MIPGGVNELLLRSAAAGGATAGRSVRFNSADSASLSKTFSSTGNRKTYTLSLWCKRSKIGGAELLLTRAGNPENTFRFNSDALELFQYSGGFTWQLVTTQLFRDPSAWYHILIAFDTTQATSSNRVKLYVNGTQVTAFSTASYPSLNFDGEINTNTAHEIGVGQFNGYLALVHFIDGQALTPSSFGETSATTGQWIAKTYSGSYGTNGFFLDFLDNSTAAALGYDAAGSNDWTVNNLSVTAGSGNDSLRDHPTSAGTSTGLGGEVSGNYATWNPLSDLANGATFANGNLEVTTISSGEQSIPSTLFVSSGKWYGEITVTTSSTCSVGLIPPSYLTGQQPGITADSYGYRNNGTKITNGSVTSYGASFTNGDVIGIALDLTGGTITFYKNGSSQGTAFTSVSGTLCLAFGDLASSASTSCIANFGQRAFAYTAPSGFSPLVDTLLPTPTIAKPNTVMDVVTYTGSGASKTITLPGAFNPDLVWIKARSIGYAHALFDVIRGGRKILISNSTAAEDDLTAYSSGITSFNSDGFTLDSDGAGYTNESTRTYVGWCWDAGSSNATNTSGTITSTVRANISAGFSVISFAATGSNGTVGHGLGVAPAFIIGKNRSSTSLWRVYHSSIAATKVLFLNSTDAATTDIAFNSTAPTSSVISVNGSEVLNNSGNIILYAWTPVAGYSAFGSYTGNGSTDGPFVYTGFRPAFLLIKISDAAGQNWMMYDNKRGAYNLNSKKVAANLSLEENEVSSLGGDTVGVDFLSNGFKIRTTGGNHNSNGYTYTYSCFAESPLAYARAR